jgi:hypothetical protein
MTVYVPRHAAEHPARSLAARTLADLPRAQAVLMEQVAVGYGPAVACAAVLVLHAAEIERAS